MKFVDSLGKNENFIGANLVVVDGGKMWEEVS